MPAASTAFAAARLAMRLATWVRAAALPLAVMAPPGSFLPLRAATLLALPVLPPPVLLLPVLLVLVFVDANLAGWAAATMWTKRDLHSAAGPGSAGAAGLGSGGPAGPAGAADPAVGMPRAAASTTPGQRSHSHQIVSVL